jgi:hypothetical protein
LHLRKLMGGIRELKAQHAAMEEEEAKRRRIELKRLEAQEEEQERDAAALVEKIKNKKEKEREREREYQQREREKNIKRAEEAERRRERLSKAEADKKVKKSTSPRASRGVSLARSVTNGQSGGVVWGRIPGDAESSGMDRMKVERSLKDARKLREAKEARIDRYRSMLICTE